MTLPWAFRIDAIAPARHIGVAMGMIGKDSWTANVGLYSLSFQDLNTRPVNTSSGNPGLESAPVYSAVGIPRTNWYQPWGGGYWEATGRLTWAQIFDEHRLVLVGVSGSYHRPNSSTAYSDERNMAPGNRLGSEANIPGSTRARSSSLSCAPRFTFSGRAVRSC